MPSVWPAAEIDTERGTMEFAGFWKRSFALLVDGLILAAGETLLSYDRGVSGLVGAAYFIAMEASPWQATLGKRLLGIRVTDMDGGRISGWRAAGRHFAKLISAFVLLIGFFMAAFTEKKQGLHDMIAGCLVVADSR